MKELGGYMKEFKRKSDLALEKVRTLKEFILATQKVMKSFPSKHGKDFPTKPHPKLEKLRRLEKHILESKELMNSLFSEDHVKDSPPQEDPEGS